ncbi:MAG: prolyl oligopeptidase family serine peptidase [Muribaculaceae bacterium]|nr:prolyl oligopeptidase family serine peptidase [Muribaculaceae bacterium]
MKKTMFLAAAILLTGSISAKKTLTHDDFDAWEKLSNGPVSVNGKWASFIVMPQEGDQTLTLYNTSTGKRIVVPRGKNLSFTADSRYALAMIKPFYQDTRNARIKKKKDFDLPQDSLAIINLSSGSIEKIGNVISYSIGKKGGNWVAWLSCDTAYIKPKALKNKDAGRPMILRSLDSGHTKKINWVSDYIFSEDGTRLAVTLKTVKKDTLATPGAGVIMLPDTSFHLLDRDKAFYGAPVFNKDGSKLAFIASDDSVKTGTKHVELFLTDLQGETYDPKKITLSDKATNSNSLMLNQYSQPAFSEDGKRLVVGVAPYVAPDDTTLVSFETPSLDIWRWDAPYTPPQANNRIERLRKANVPVVITLSDNRQVLIADDVLDRVVAPDRWNGDWAMVVENKNVIERQYDYNYPVEIILKNVMTGEAKDAGEYASSTFSLSPADRFILWFDGKDYFTYEISTGTKRLITEKISVNFWDEDVDRPEKIRSDYGVMGWTENDGRVLVYDRYDVWSLDPLAVEAPVCLTAGEGRKKNIRYRWKNLNREQRFLRAGDKIIYTMFNYDDMKNGVASAVFSLKPAAPKTDFYGEWEYDSFAKAQDADVYSWMQANFSTSPNIYVSTDIEKGKAKKISDTNPQMKDYKWGTARLVHWTTYQGHDAKGILYLPEDFSKEKEYPMIAYFYETYSQDLYHHFNMEPSWSWINFPFYVSRDYAVFVPDIHYSPGIPGENAYDYVCSGVEAVCKQYPNIDIKRVGIDGQSWGGYQTAFLVTRTNMFACAGSGAPVANMTSAFGGIRWESGDSRQGQYEQGQSRIGHNLWETPELYIANSPVFHANRVETPLLIMHNDADGAVPWYQGIEMFMALRRLHKPVWMLQYNGEAHNLKERRNRKDITIRLQQFFDHYLKGDPMPEWMKNGINPLRKGQDFGYELTEE